MKKSQIISISIIAIVLIVTQIQWFTNGNIISGADFALSGFSGETDFLKNIYTWNEAQYWGSGNFWNTSLIIWDGFFAILEKSNIPLQIAERVLFGAMLIGGIVGIKKFLKAQNKSSYFWIIGALYYSANLFTIIAWHNLIIFVLLAYTLLPWFLYLLTKILNPKTRSKRKYQIHFVLLTLLASPIAQNPPTVIGVLLLPIILYGIYLILSQKNKLSLIKKSTILIIATIFLHSWWLLPSVYGSLNFATEAPVADLTASLTRNTEHLTELNVLNLGGHWGLYETNLEGNKSMEYSDYYTEKNSLGKYIGLLFPLLAILSILTNKNYKKPKWWFWLTFTLVFFFLTQGPNGLTGKLFIWATQNIPGFWMFRSPEYKFLPGFILGTTILLNSVRFSQKSLKKIAPPTLIIISVAVNFLYAYPFFNNYLFEPEHQVRDAKEVYSDFLSWQKNEDKESRLYITPQQKGAYLHYTWGYEGIDPSIHILGLSNGGITESTRKSSDLANYINTELYRGKKVEVLKYLWDITGTNYILQRNDTDYEIYPDHLLQNSPEEIKERLAKIEGIELDKNLGDWDVYKVNNSNQRVQVHTDTQFYKSSTKLFAEKITQERNSQKLFTQIENENTIPENSSITLTLPTYDTNIIHKNNGWILKDGSLVTSQEHHENAEVTYSIDIPQSGEYTIAVYIKPGNKDAKLSYKINEEEYSHAVPSPQENNDDPFDFVKTEWNTKKLEKGSYKITLQNSAPENTKGLQEIEALVIEKQGNEVVKITPTIEYTRISPTKWEIAIENAQTPYYLTLLESYHPGWTAYTEVNKKKTKVDKKMHYTSNEFANSWYIEDINSQKIIIEFWPQKLLYLGGIISIITLLGLLIAAKTKK